MYRPLCKDALLEDKLRKITFIVTDMDGVLTDGSVWFDGEGRPFRSINARDCAGLTLWRLMDGRSALVSGLGSKALESITAQWKFDELHMWIRDKTRVCREIADRHHIPLEQMAFIGDDLIDVRAMRSVGLAVAAHDAEEAAQREAHLITHACGGRGVLREVVCRILEAQGRLDEAVDRYCSRKDA